MSDRLSFDQFLAFLKQKVRERASARLQLVTDNHHTVWVALRNGTIVSLYYGPKKGESALERMISMTGGSLNQAPELDFPDTPGLPSTREILRRLEASAGGSRPPDKTVEPVREPTQVSDEYGISAERVERISTEMENLLQQYLGPIASLVISRARRRHGGVRDEMALRRFVDDLVEEVVGIGDALRLAGL